MNNSNVIAPRMFKLYLQPLSLKLRKNGEAHIDYLNITKEHDDTLCGIVEQARALKPLDNMLDYACKFATRKIRSGSNVMPHALSSQNDNGIWLLVTPMNRNRQVTFEKTSAKSENNTQKRADSHKTQTTNKPLLPSTGVKSSTNDSGSQPTSNIKITSTNVVPPRESIQTNVITNIPPLKQFEPPPSVKFPMPPIVASLPADTIGISSSTTIDQDAQFASTSPTTEETRAPIIHQGVEEQQQGI
ncbi:hypothetical protein Tco_0461223 [Tanacetum coccineum]